MDSDFDFDEEESEDYVDEDDLFLGRDEHGDLIPVETSARGYGKVKALPMTYGKAERMFGDGQGMQTMDSDLVAEVIRDHIVKPDLSDITGDMVRDEMEPMAPQALLFAVMEVSGLGDAEIDVDQEGEASIEFQSSGN